MLERLKQYIQPDKEGNGHDALLSLGRGALITFAPSMPIRELAGQEARVVSVRSYRFGPDNTISYSLSINGSFGYHLTAVRDEQGIYLGISRELPQREWAEWFDVDALDFFLTPSSARILKLLANARVSPEWSAPRYNKVLEAVKGELHDGIPGPDDVVHAQAVEYTLLASDSGEKAIEIERLTEKQTSRLYATVYRPQEDIIAIEIADEGAQEEEPAPQPMPEVTVVVATPEPEAIQEDMAPLAVLAPKQGARPDFRRLSPVPVPAPAVAEDPVLEDEVPALPSFLLEPKTAEKAKKRYLSLDDVIAPEPERLRCDMLTAKALILEASARAIPVREVVRDLLGLPLQVKEEVMFDLPLSESDYKELAMRYQLKASHKQEIRERLVEELRQKVLLSI